MDLPEHVFFVGKSRDDGGCGGVGVDRDERHLFKYYRCILWVSIGDTVHRFGGSCAERALEIAEYDDFDGGGVAAHARAAVGAEGVWGDDRFVFGDYHFGRLVGVEALRFEEDDVVGENRCFVADAIGLECAEERSFFGDVFARIADLRGDGGECVVVNWRASCGCERLRGGLCGALRRRKGE